MTNTELIQLFRDISKLDNCFDREVALKRATKAYKKTSFYKETKYSINRAYLIFTVDGLHTLSILLNSKVVSDLARGDISSLQARIEYFIETLDTELLSDTFNSIVSKIISVEGDTETLKTDLLNIIQEFQSSLK